jgi:hypothetical protein
MSRSQIRKLARLLEEGTWNLAGADESERWRQMSRRRQPDESLLQTILRLIQTEPKRTLKHVLHALDKTIDDLNREEVAPMMAFNVFGCPLSTDIDVVYAVSEPKYVHWEIDREVLVQQLSALGYDVTNRAIDINVVYASQGNIHAFKHGSKELQNILLSTYPLHAQAYPCVVQRKLDSVDAVEDRIHAIAKYILDHLEAMLSNRPGEYEHERPNKQFHYMHGGWNRIEFALGQLRHLPEEQETTKSLTLKMIQLILRDRLVVDMLYTKRELADAYQRMFPDTGDVWHLLTRQPLLEPSYQAWTHLVMETCRIAQDQKRQEEFDWQEVASFDVSVNRFAHLPDTLWTAFWNSPSEASDVFCHLMMDRLVETAGSINACFPLPSRNAHLLNALPHVTVSQTEQRSAEWIGVYNQVRQQTPERFGSPAAEARDFPTTQPEQIAWIRTHFHLFRGVFGEAAVLGQADVLFPGQDAVTVGFIQVGQLTIAPDLLLFQEDGRVVPVEIKCLAGTDVGPQERRAIRLAKRQLRSVQAILGTSSTSDYAYLVIVDISDQVRCRTAKLPFA